MVVAVGLTLVEPLADADVNAPGVMATLVAAVVAQLSVLLEPEVIVVGRAINEVIVGTEGFPEDEPDDVIAPHPASPRQASKKRTRAQRLRAEELNPRELRLLRQDELVESMRGPRQTQSMAHDVVAVVPRGRCPLGHPRPFISRIVRVIRRSTIDFKVVSCRDEARPVSARP